MPYLPVLYLPSFEDTILEDFLSVCRINMIKSEREWCVGVCVCRAGVVKNSIKFKNASLSNFIKL